MKKNYSKIAVAMALSIGVGATAQQLPNGGFDSEWVDCVPWTSKNNTVVVGTQPANWIVSNVSGMSGTGATTVASQVSGGYDGSTYAVKLTNTSNPFKASEIVPAYMSLGSTWATSTGLLSIKNKDGGVFGGIEFTNLPDAVSFYYQRSHGTAKPEEPASLVAYMWKGTWTQADVPGETASSSPATVSMADRDKNILGMTTDQGGEVTKTEDAELIASINYSISGDATSWTRCEQPFTYVSESVPEKINVVIAANDYFGGASAVGKNNSLTVDNVALVYYSRLLALSVNGAAVDGFASDVYSYTMAGTELPAEDQIAATVLGRSAVKAVVVDAEAATVTITVSNIGADSDGLTSHAYVLQYEKAPAKVGVSTDYPGYLNGRLLEGDQWTVFATNEEKTITITEYEDGTCDFLLPNLYLSVLDLSLGDILVEGATVTKGDDGVATYAGFVDDMQLLGGQLVADVTLNGTINAMGEVNMNIDVDWMGVPIECTFTTNQVSGVDMIVAPENAKVEYYNLQGVKVANPENGMFIRVEGNKAVKVLVK